MKMNKGKSHIAFNHASTELFKKKKKTPVATSGHVVGNSLWLHVSQVRVFICAVSQQMLSLSSVTENPGSSPHRATLGQTPSEQKPQEEPRLKKGTHRPRVHIPDSKTNTKKDQS